jgi:hypothetical protein
MAEKVDALGIRNVVGLGCVAAGAACALYGWRHR